MNNQKSIIGCGYIPRKAQAVCLKTNANARLGEVAYKITKGPYERVFEHQELLAMMPIRQKHMAVDVLDANTGLTYAVEYEPANLVRPTSAPETARSGKTADFAVRVGQIAKELKALFDAGGEFSTSAVLHSLRFRMTGTVRHRRARVSSVGVAVVSWRL